MEKSSGKKYYYRSKKKEIKMCGLFEYNARKYLEDYAIIGKLSYVSRNRLDWITNTRYQLQFSANKSEKLFGKFLIENKIEFIHQMPFVISNKIYFLDFYFPKKHIAIEIDGMSHETMEKREHDKYRDEQFNSIKIKTYRISNSEVINFA